MLVYLMRVRTASGTHHIDTITFRLLQSPLEAGEDAVLA